MTHLKHILNLFLTTMLLFVVQKLYFLALTWHPGTTLTDVLQVLVHGLRLDAAVAGYTLVLPLVLAFGLYIAQLLKADARLCRTIFRRVMLPYYALIALLTAVIIVADAALYPFWQFKLDASVFLYTDKPKDAMASVSLWFVLFQVLAVTIWFSAYFFSFFKAIQNAGRNAPKRWPNRYLSFAVYLMFMAMTALAIRGGVGQGTNNVSVAYYSDNQYLNHSAVNPVFSLLYSMGKQEDFASKYQFYDEAERAQIMQGIYDQQPSDTASIRLLNTQRPDIVLIVWEGCCEAMQQPDITPNLSRIASESVCFSKCYANSFRTDRGLVCLLAGYLGLPDASLMKIPNKNEHLPALPRALAAQGYKNTFWYAGDITFTNMGGYMRQAGFHRTVSDRDFTAAERTTDWGAPDQYLFKKCLSPRPSPPQGKGSKAGGPLFDCIMTLSSHEPWDVPTHRLKAQIPNAFNYTDECLGRFIAQLKRSPRWRNTLVIITADHGVMSRDDDTRYAHRVVHIPMLWTGGAIRQPMVIDRIMNQSDLAATLLGQLGIPHSEFTFSRDVLSSAYRYPTATHTYNNGTSFIDSTGITTYDNDAQRVISGPDPQRERKAKATLQTLYKKVSEL